jgi:hypothetical protein
LITNVPVLNEQMLRGRTALMDWLFRRKPKAT